MESVETALYWLIGIGVAIMIAGVIVMRLEKKKKGD
jgi:general stress protein CsbA